MMNARTLCALVLGLLCLAQTALASPPPAPSPPLSDEAMAERTQACTACHGLQGKAGPDGYYPRLAGKPAGYLAQQLRNFREDRRHYAPMSQLITPLSDAYLLEIAEYFASLSVPYPPARPSNLTQAETARAKTLVTRGDAALGITACQDCHGRALTGVQPMVPGLLGLPADYINAQLGGWQSGQRKAHAPDCMAPIARKLSSGDVSVLARWLAAQAVPVPSTPAQRPPANADSAFERQCVGPTAASGSPTGAAGGTPERVALIARGAYLARIGNCGQCHSARGGDPFAGGLAIDTPFGSVLTSNITPDPVHGLGRWSAQDFWQALHHGVSKDGRALYPAFPYTSFTHVTREDSDALFAYLQSLPPSATPNQPHQLRWPYSSQIALKAWRLAFFKPAQQRPVDATPGTPQALALERGAYLVRGLGHCDECHAPRNFLGAMQADDAGAGYVLPVSQWFAPSLTRGQRSPLDVREFLQTGKSAKGYASGPMAEVVLHGTQYLTDADASAMALYLQSAARVVPSAEPVSPIVVRGANSDKKGSLVYEKHCADCHGKEGQGRSGAYPALAGNAAVLRENTNNLVLMVLQGGYPAATVANPRPHGMPPYVLQLNNAEIAAVLTTVRNSWGNGAAAVSEFDINKLRLSQSR